ncbi:MAG: type II secretion system protein [Cyanobacteria bacterium P01_G01_bin.39]
MLLYDVLKKSNKGFTLVEMLAALVIVSIMAAFAAPNLLGMLNQARVKDGLGKVEGAIREAQKLAVRRGKTCKIKFVNQTIGGKSRQVITVVESTDADETVSANYYNGCLLERRILPLDVTVDSGGITKITFTPRGNTVNESFGTIIVSHSSAANTGKCLQIQGALGTILTGNYDSSATPPCQISKAD